jgi:hypothetical protein
VDRNVGVCISLETNGDAELFLESSDLHELISTLQAFENKVT